MHKITRISYNSADWQRPTGDARVYEVAGTYNHEHGFGHEDWLFRTEWLIDGWRYAFIQGVNKSHSKLVEAGIPLDLTLFTIQPDKNRQFIATIHAVECLDDQQAQDALKVFKRQGWYKIMHKEISMVGGDTSALGDAKYAKHILNVRFRQENVQRYSTRDFAPSDSPLLRWTRYQLYDVEGIHSQIDKPEGVRKRGSTSLPKILKFLRQGSTAIEVTPEHSRMQEKLMKELKTEYPKAVIIREKDYIDVSVQTEQEQILFEIKSDLEPRTVIRQAMGQILEYAYHPNRAHSLPVRLVIVGRHQPSPLDNTYLKHLQSEFSLPLTYRVVEI